MRIKFISTKLVEKEIADGNVFIDAKLWYKQNTFYNNIDICIMGIDSCYSVVTDMELVAS